MSRRLLVLAWHTIEPSWSFPGTSPQACRRGFERQLGLLRRWANVVPLRTSLVALREGRELPGRAVALTFDDGYLDAARVVAPTLEAAGMPATFFLVSSFLSGEARCWWEDLGWAFSRASASELTWKGSRYHLSRDTKREAARAALTAALKLVDDRQRWSAVEELLDRLSPIGTLPAHPFLDWDEARRLVRRGHDIGSHTCEHRILSREQTTIQIRELVQSRDDLAAYLDRPVDVLAYPNGKGVDYSGETVGIARDAGYRFALTTRPALAAPTTPRLEVPRVVVGPETDLLELLRRAFNGATRVVSGAVSTLLAARRAPDAVA